MLSIGLIKHFDVQMVCLEYLVLCIWDTVCRDAKVLTVYEFNSIMLHNYASLLKIQNWKLTAEWNLLYLGGPNNSTSIAKMRLLYYWEIKFRITSFIFFLSWNDKTFSSLKSYTLFSYILLIPFKSILI